MIKASEGKTLRALLEINQELRFADGEVRRIRRGIGLKADIPGDNMLEAPEMDLREFEMDAVALEFLLDFGSEPAGQAENICPQ